MSEFSFDQYGNLSNMDALIGKTIAEVESGEGCILPLPEGECPATWIISFTDDTRIKLRAHYDDSEVFWEEAE